MLFYIRCPSCGRVISKNIDKFYEESEAIANDPKMNKKQKDKAFSKILEPYGPICCKMRMMGLIPYHEIIIT